MRRLLDDAIAAICAPWKIENEARAKREELIKETLWRLPYGATDGEKARAAASARAGLSDVPLTASDTEMRAAVSAAIEPITKGIEDRRASEEAMQEPSVRLKRPKETNSAKQKTVGFLNPVASMMVFRA